MLSNIFTSDAINPNAPIKNNTFHKLKNYASNSVTLGYTILIYLIAGLTLIFIIPNTL